MSKCSRKKYIKTNIRQMTMETVESPQDGSIINSVVERDSGHMQTQSGQNSIPTLAQVATIAETDESAESEGVIDPHKRREILSRRPSYRKILNELSSDVPGIPKIEEEKSEEEGTPPNIAMAVPTSIYQTSTGQYSMYAAIPYNTGLLKSPLVILKQFSFSHRLVPFLNASLTTKLYTIKC
ncbi:PREDICTED: cAMP-responsive element modulator isoform X4 [Dipodomys ordii]|uniref:cAMP-responsive element modulator n=1 Tax=Dipodomys ordii TaxID=10020 RepID=A0A1S3ELL0_DIPOR|nr:PREDICTED: cAMP-responsive element modulator isoform X4 [Dipodomys ordii]